MPTSEQLKRVDLTGTELELLLDGLDAHEYWELSEPRERRNGFSTIDDAASREVDAIRQLIAQLERCASSGTERAGHTQAP